MSYSCKPSCNGSQHASAELVVGSIPSVQPTRKRQTSIQSRTGVSKIPRALNFDGEDNVYLSKRHDSDDATLNSHEETNAGTPNNNRHAIIDLRTERKMRTLNWATSDAITVSDHQSTPLPIVVFGSKASPASDPTPTSITAANAEPYFVEADKQFQEAIRTMRELETEIDRDRVASKAASETLLSLHQAKFHEVEDRLVDVLMAKRNFNARLTTFSLETESAEYVLGQFREREQACRDEMKSLECKMIKEERIQLTLDKGLAHDNTKYWLLERWEGVKERASCLTVYWKAMVDMLTDYRKSFAHKVMG